MAPSTANNSIAPANPGSSTIADASISVHKSSDDDEFGTLQTRYSETQDKPEGKKKHKAQVHPVMEDIVNATHRSLTCRRAPMDAFLKNNKAGEWFPFLGDVR
jgi:hypothetical protein